MEIEIGKQSQCESQSRCRRTGMYSSLYWPMVFIISVMGAGLNNPNGVRADEHNHKYRDGEEVVLWMNTVGPYHNLQETYAYFSLPFCRGAKTSISHYHETLSEALQGVELEFSGFDIEFNRKCRIILRFI